MRCRVFGLVRRLFVRVARVRSRKVMEPLTGREKDDKHVKLREGCPVTIMVCAMRTGLYITLLHYMFVE